MVKEKSIEIHLSNIDEFLAEKYLEYGSTFKVELSGINYDGFLRVKDSFTNKKLTGEAVDFELSASECHGLSDTELIELIKQPVYTSSAYEFFDSFFQLQREAKCLINLVGGSWLISIKD